MYRDKSIGVVVPAHNEEKLIDRVIETMPDCVDRIIVIDDQSQDQTVAIVESFVEKLPQKVYLIKHTENQGVGGAIITGYKRAVEEGLDITVVMAGDAQMDPDDLEPLLNPIVEERADYSKGNRLFTGDAWNIIPHYRYLGNSVLSLWTKIASGYWNVADSQSGYTAITLKALKALHLDKIYKRYGMPNDMLVQLNVNNARVVDVPIKPVYNIGEVSGIKLSKVIPTISWLLFKRFLWRMKERYIIRDFHPLVFFYCLGIMTFPVGFIFGVYLLIKRFLIGPVAPTSALFAVFLFIAGLQSLFFAMWMDMETNRRLIN